MSERMEEEEESILPQFVSLSSLEVKGRAWPCDGEKKDGSFSISFP